MDTIYDITLAIYHNSTLYAYFKLVRYHQKKKKLNVSKKFYVSKKLYVQKKNKKNLMFQVCYVTSEFSKHIQVNENLFAWALTGVVYSNLLYRLPTSRLILAFGVQNF